MSIARVQIAENGGGNSASALTVAFGASVTAGNLIVVCVEVWNTGVTVTVTDSLGNTYSQAGSYAANSQYRAAIFYAVNVTGGACTVTVTPSATAYRSVVCLEYSGAEGSAPLDGTSGNTGSSTALSTGSVAVSQAGGLVIGLFSTFAAWASMLVTAGGGLAFARSSTATPSNLVTEQIGAAAAVNPSITSSPSVVWAAAGASFKAASSGAGGGLLLPYGGLGGGLG